MQVVWIHSSSLLGYGREILLSAFKSKNIHACLLSSQENFRLSVMGKTAWFYLKFLTLWTVKGFNIRSSCLSFSLPSSQMLFIAVTVTTDSRSMLELCTFSPPIIPIWCFPFLWPPSCDYCGTPVTYSIVQKCWKIMQWVAS